MDCITSHIPPQVLAAAEDLGLDPQWLSVGLVASLTFIAAYLGYAYVLCRREAPVKFNVPVPPEVRPNWVAKNWDDVQGEDKALLEAQARGVSGFPILVIFVRVRVEARLADLLCFPDYSNGAKRRS